MPAPITATDAPRADAGTPTLGVAIITRDAGPRFAECLAAVAFADRIVVLDSGSRDGTVALARAAGGTVLEHSDWPGFGPQKNRAIEQLDTDWILVVDSDEVVSAALRDAIGAALRREDADVFALDRLSSFCGHWMHHAGWYPDWVPRLFRRGRARFSDDLVHERLVYSGAATRLSGQLLHYSYEDSASVLRKMAAYAEAGARQRFARGERATLGKAGARGAWAFVRTYVLKRGFLDGKAGLLVALFNAQTVFYRFVRLAELGRGADDSASPR
ncbi:glycosyltransferase family 2 protein [Chitinasiproducens palmae]|nr:glycosyltransferase family 2 protein [Chitinasiproducens palmae]